MSRHDVPMDGLMIPQTFADAAQQIMGFLEKIVGFRQWVIARTEREDWTVLTTGPNTSMLRDGEVLRWSDTLCRRIADVGGPCIVPRVADNEIYRSAPFAQRYRVGAYIGVPLRHFNGRLFGTLCGFDVQPRGDRLKGHELLLKLVGASLSAMLQRELDIQSLSRELERVKVESQLDALTNVYNRRGWERFVAQEETRCKRYASPVSVIIVDLDDLKQVNDRNGHDMGDQLLRRTARLLRSVVRSNDIVARLGGDEFGVLAVEASSDQVNQLARRVQISLVEEEINASIGWATRRASESIRETVAQADAHMYEMKRQRQHLMRAQPG